MRKDLWEGRSNSLQICRPKFAVMPQMPIFEKKGLNRKIKATTFGDEQGETEGWNKETWWLYNIEGFRKISSTICLGYPHWIKRSKNKALVQLKSALKDMCYSFILVTVCYSTLVFICFIHIHHHIYLCIYQWYVYIYIYIYYTLLFLIYII